MSVRNSARQPQQTAHKVLSKDQFAASPVTSRHASVRSVALAYAGLHIGATAFRAALGSDGDPASAPIEVP